MTAGMDRAGVLAMMDAVIVDLSAALREPDQRYEDVEKHHSIKRAVAARAAIAELIDAAESHNEASDEYASAYGEDATRALRGKIAARARLDAALARAQGAHP